MKTPGSTDAYQARYQIAQIKKITKVSENIALAQVWALLAVADSLNEIARAIQQNRTEPVGPVEPLPGLSAIFAAREPVKDL